MGRYDESNYQDISSGGANLQGSLHWWRDERGENGKCGRTALAAVKYWIKGETEEDVEERKGLLKLFHAMIEDLWKLLSETEKKVVRSPSLVYLYP
jgi:hypothetical protein